MTTPTILTGQRIASSPIPAPRQTAVVQPSRAGDQIAAVGKQMYETELKNSRDMAIVEADSKLKQLTTYLLYDPKDGAMTKQQKEAAAAYQPAMDAFDSGAQDLESQFPDPEVRRAFAHLRAVRRDGMNQQLTQHVGQQIRVYDDEQTKAYVDNSRNNAINSFNDMAMVESEVSDTRNVILSHARRNGQSDVVAEMRVKDAASQTWAGVIARHLDSGNDLFAKKIFEEHRGDLVGRDALMVEKAVTEGSLRGESQRQSDDILQNHNDRETALEAVNKIKDPQIRDATQARVLQGLEQRAHIEREQGFKAYKSAADHVTITGTTDSIPAKDWALLDPDQKASIERFARTRFRQINFGEEPVNDYRAWTNFVAMDQNTLASISAGDFDTRFRSKLDDPHYNSALAIWRSARDAVERAKNGKESDPSSHVTQFYGVRDRIIGTMKIAGIIPGDATIEKLSSEQQIQFAKIMEISSAQMSQIEIAQKRKLLPEEQQQVLDDLLINKKVSIDVPWGRDKHNVPVQTLTDEQTGSAYVEFNKIPAKFIDNYRKMALSNHWVIGPDFEERMQRAYPKAMVGDQEGFLQIMGVVPAAGTPEKKPAAPHVPDAVTDPSGSTTRAAPAPTPVPAAPAPATPAPGRDAKGNLDPTTIPVPEPSKEEALTQKKMTAPPTPANVVSGFGTAPTPANIFGTVTPQRVLTAPAPPTKNADKITITPGAPRNAAGFVDGMIETGNIDLVNRPRVKNGNTISTVLSGSYNIDGREVLLPHVSKDGRLMNGREAITEYKNTGEHLGIFKNSKAADAYAQSLHLDQEKMLKADAKVEKKSAPAADMTGKPAPKAPAAAPKSANTKDMIVEGNFPERPLSPKDHPAWNKLLLRSAPGRLQRDDIPFFEQNLGLMPKKARDEYAPILIRKLIEKGTPANMAENIVRSWYSKYE